MKKSKTEKVEISKEDYEKYVKPNVKKENEKKRILAITDAQKQEANRQIEEIIKEIKNFYDMKMKEAVSIAEEFNVSFYCNPLDTDGGGQTYFTKYMRENNDFDGEEPEYIKEYIDKDGWMSSNNC